MAEPKKNKTGKPPKERPEKPKENPGQDPDDVMSLQAVARAAAQLAKNKEAFNQAVDAFNASDASQFQAALDRAGVGEHCDKICFFLCRKKCVAICLRFCLEPNPGPFDVAEMMAFAEALDKLASDQAAFRRLEEIVEKEDVEAWNAFIRQYQLGQFCHQLCHFFCEWRCREICVDLCPPKPLITRVGSIPISQIGSTGLGNGPSIPPFHVAPPNPSAGYGDHPFGASVWLMGVFNMPSATQYLVEVSSTGPLGPYNPLIVASVTGYDLDPYFSIHRPMHAQPEHRSRSRLV